MLRLVFALSVLAASGFSAQADTCEELVKQAQAGLGGTKLHEVVKDRLQEMLRTGLSGDSLQCEQVANGSLSSPKPDGGENCNPLPTV